MSLPNFTLEAGRLLAFTGRVGEAIFQNAPSFEKPPWVYHPPKHADHAWALSECLLYFSDLGRLLQGDDMAAIENCCNQIIDHLSELGEITTHYRPIPKNEGIALAREIIEKVRLEREYQLLPSSNQDSSGCRPRPESLSKSSNASGIGKEDTTKHDIQNVFTATRLRQLGRYGFRLVYVGDDDPQVAFEKYCRDNLDCLSDAELYQLKDSLSTARVTTLDEFSN